MCSAPSSSGRIFAILLQGGRREILQHRRDTYARRSGSTRTSTGLRTRSLGSSLLRMCFAEFEGICRALFDHAFPLAAEKERLHKLFCDRSGKRDSSEVFLPQRPEELGFWHYWAVFTVEEFFSRPEPFCHWSRAKFTDEIDRARLIRNDVMHFKRQAEPREIDRLRLLRDQLASIEQGWVDARGTWGASALASGSCAHPHSSLARCPA